MKFVIIDIIAMCIIESKVLKFDENKEIVHVKPGKNKLK